MKKINKLLLPIVGVTTISTGLIPLTSCNKQKVTEGQKVTEDEWKTAIGYLCGLSDKEVYWQTKDGSYLINYTEEESQSAIISYDKWIYNPTGFFTHQTTDGEYFGWEKEEADIWEIFDGYFIYDHVYVKDAKQIIYEINEFEYSGLKLMIEFFSKIYNYYNYFTYEKDGYYHYNGELSNGVALNTKIGFNSNKQLSHFENTYIDEEKHAYSVSKIDYDYSHTVIQWPEGFEKRVKNHTANMTSDTAYIDTTSHGKEQEGLIINIAPDVDGYTTLSCFDQEEKPTKLLRNLVVIKNGTELKADTDYTCDEEKLVFKTPLTTNDFVSIHSASYVFVQLLNTLKLTK